MSPIDRSKIHIVKRKFPKHFQPNYQKGRRVPISLKDRINTEIKKLHKEEHIEKLYNCSEQFRNCYYSQRRLNYKISPRFKISQQFYTH